MQIHALLTMPASFLLHLLEGQQSVQKGQRLVLVTDLLCTKVWETAVHDHMKDSGLLL